MPVYFCSLFIAFIVFWLEKDLFFFEKRELSVLLISLGTFHVRNIGKVLVSAPHPSLMGNIVALSIVYKMETRDLPLLCQSAKSARIVHIGLEFSSSFSLLCLLHAYFLSQNIMTPLWLYCWTVKVIVIEPHLNIEFEVCIHFGSLHLGTACQH